MLPVRDTLSETHTRDSRELPARTGSILGGHHVEGVSINWIRAESTKSVREVKKYNSFLLMI